MKCSNVALRQAEPDGKFASHTTLLDSSSGTQRGSLGNSGSCWSLDLRKRTWLAYSLLQSTFQGLRHVQSTVPQASMNIALFLFHWALLVSLSNIFLFYQKAKRYCVPCPKPLLILGSFAGYTANVLFKDCSSSRVRQMSVLGFIEHLFILNISTANETCLGGASWN